MARTTCRGVRMTKERKLAIQMWQEIVNKCKARDDFNYVEVLDKNDVTSAEIILNALRGGVK